MLLGSFADGNVVGLAPGKIMQGGAKTFVAHHAKVYLKAVAEEDTGLGFTLGQHLGDFIKIDKGLHDRALGRGHREDIEIAHGLPASSIASGQGKLLYSSACLEVF